MAERSQDRRSLKTKRALCDGLAELLMDKPLHKVTVQEIADKAEVNRVTFYKHYLDVYDLYEKMEKDVLVELGLLILQLEELPQEEYFSHLIGYIDENRRIFKLIFCPNNTGQLREKFDKLMEGLMKQLQNERQEKVKDSRKLDYLNCYRAQGCIAVIGKWVLGGFSDPKDFVIKIISSLDISTEDLMDESLSE